MPDYSFKLYCGLPGAGLGQILGRTGHGDAKQWFEGRRIYYVHKTRVAIRWTCKLIGLRDGAEVLAPSYNCGSEIDPLLKSGASVVLYRIDRQGQVDMGDLRRRITNKTKVVYVTHYFGFPQPTAEIKALCEGKDIYVIEDCALSLFSRDKGIILGTISDISVFNFPKSLPVPDGGAMMINNSCFVAGDADLCKIPITKISRQLLSLLKRHVLHGMSSSNSLCRLLAFKLGKKRSSGGRGQVHNSFPDMPSSYYYDEKLSDKAVSIITRRMFESFNVSEIVERHRNNFKRYLNLLSNCELIRPLFTELPAGICPLYFPVIVKNRDVLCRRLNEQAIAAIPWWAGYHQGLPWMEYPDACFLKDNLMALPVHQQLKSKHIEYVAKTLIASIN